MAVSQQALYKALQEQGVEFHPRGHGFHLRHPNGGCADLRRLSSPTDAYKIKEVRHLFGKLHLDRHLASKYIPDLIPTPLPTAAPPAPPAK